MASLPERILKHLIDWHHRFTRHRSPVTTHRASSVDLKYVSIRYPAT